MYSDSFRVEVLPYARLRLPLALGLTAAGFRSSAPPFVLIVTSLLLLFILAKFLLVEEGESHPPKSGDPVCRSRLCPNIVSD